MTNPEQNQQTNPPNAQPPHAPTQPEQPPQVPQQRQPVVVPPVDNSGLTERVNEMGRVLAGLPEQIVNSFREATQPAQPPQQAQQPQAQQGGQQSQPPGTDNNPPATPPATSEPARGPQPSRFARWWKGVN